MTAVFFKFKNKDIYIYIYILSVCGLPEIYSIWEGEDIEAVFWSIYISLSIGFPSDSAVKNPPAMWETWVQSFGQEDLLEKKMATHSSILAWKISRIEEPGEL